MSDPDHDFEQVPGLPGALPKGEQLLWQGRPNWRVLARRTFKLNWLIAYLAGFVALRLFTGLQNGEGVQAFIAAGLATGLCVVCVGVVLLLSWGYSRATLYSITSERVVMRIGVAIPLTVNLPFRRIASADLKAGSGAGDIVLRLSEASGISWFHLWPHAQARYLTKPRPTLLSLSQPQEVAQVLADAVGAWSSRRGAAVMLGDLVGDTKPASAASGAGQLLSA